MPEKPIKLGKYTLGEILGAGGFGTVYKATDPSGRTVAIKVLKPGWNDDPGAIERFRREAQVAGELFHSRIATIIDFDEADGRLYLVMRYIDGIPLNELIKQKGRLEWEETIQILEQVAEGLDYAHQRGLVHRDIKPANILISEKDGAVITDFGLVKAADVSGMSTSGVMLGTPHYIAPEIWEGKPATPQTDIYSLACVAYEMLTGQLLFAGVSPPEVMTRHIQSAHSLSQKSSQGLPAGVRTVILNAIQRDLQKRYPNIQAFLTDLRKQKANLQQDVVVKAQRIAREAGNLIQRNELIKAQQKIEELAELMQDSALIASLEQKIESMSRLSVVYGEVVEHYQTAQEKASAILTENPAYPDAKGLFPRLGLRAGKPVPTAQPKIGTAQPAGSENRGLRWHEKAINLAYPVLKGLFLRLGLWPGKPGPVAQSKIGTTQSSLPENTELRWHEKTMPYLLIFLGLATLVFGVGLPGLVAGIGLFWRKNWARKTGMVFAGLLEFASFGITYSMIGNMAVEWIGYYDAVNIVLPVVIVCSIAILLSIYLFQILGGYRMVSWTGGVTARPASIWKISIAYSSTVIGAVPAFLLLVRKKSSRLWARGYAIFLLVVLPLSGMFAAITMQRLYYDYLNGKWDYYWHTNSEGQILTAVVTLFFMILSWLAYRYLGKPEIRAYYENRES